jgi:formate dehydrogenase subunit gamma
VLRFSTAERWVHRAIAVLTLTCMATGLALYEGPVSTIVGHRWFVELVHLGAGLALPVPLLLGLASAAFRADLRSLDRFSADDRRWLRPRGIQRADVPVGKFNAGQKLNSALSTAAIWVLLGTGTLMYFTHLVRLSWRTGATFVHDWSALSLGVLVVGHVYRAAADPEARRGMRTGWVSLDWARYHHSVWAEDAAEPE